MKFRGGGATRKTAPDSDLTISHFEDKDNSSPKPLKKTSLESFYENRYVILSLTQNLSILIKNIWHFWWQKCRKTIRHATFTNNLHGSTRKPANSLTLRQSRLLPYVSPAIIVHSAIAAKSSCHSELVSESLNKKIDSGSGAGMTEPSHVHPSYHSELAAKSVERESKRDFMPLPCDSETMNEHKTFVMLNLFQHPNKILNQVQNDSADKSFVLSTNKQNILRPAIRSDEDSRMSRTPSRHSDESQNLSILIKNIWHFYRQKCRKAAFTMAEVLITLGIIGIVAAMTLPSLIANYQKKVTVTRLKRAYTVIAQTIERSKVDYGDVSGWRLDEIAGSGQASEEYIINIFVSQFWEPWVPKIQGVFYGSAKEFGYDKINGYAVDDSKLKWYVLNDGTVVGIDIIVYINNDGVVNGLNAVGYYVDINGLKKPNKFGRDLFLFQLNPVTGNIIDNSENLTREELVEKCGSVLLNNYYCAVLIAHDGWEIKDDYPW